MKNKEQYYAIYFDDPGTPAFVSFDKLYVGTLEEIGAVIDVLRTKEHYQDTVEAFDKYLQGNTTGTHVVSYRKVPILTPVTLKAESEMNLCEKRWEHLNAWNCPYNMYFEKADIKQIVVEHNGEYYRLIKASMLNFAYDNTIGQMERIYEGYWGNGFVIKAEEHENGDVLFSTLLYENESHSMLLDEEIAKLNDESQLVFDGICDEVFGDG